MTTRDGNPVHILVIAASSERRNSISAVVRTARAHILTAANISLDRIFQLAPELVIADVDTPAEAAAIIRVAEAVPAGTGLIALADNPDSRWVGAALRAGINAILSREIAAEEMRLAILAAEAGLVLLHPSSAQDLGKHLMLEHDSATLAEPLTTREQQILRLVSEGLGNKEIAAQLNISDHTVKFHISSILSKLGASSRTEAVSQGIRRGLIAI